MLSRFIRHLSNVFLYTSLPCMLAYPSAALADVFVTPESLQEQVKQHILDTTSLDDADMSLHVEAIKLPLSPIQLKGEDLQVFMSDNRPNPLSSRTIVQVNLSTSEDSRHIGIPVRILVEKPVWVTTKMIRAKEPLSRQNATLQRKLMEQEALYSLGSKENIASYTSQVNIPPGSIIDTRKLKVTPAIYRNDNIHMVLTTPTGVRISVLGKALEDGAIGTRIRVCQELANRKIKTYNGEVIDKNTVLVKM